MSEIKSWALTVCIVLITTGVFMRILPEKSNKKSVKFVATLILLVCIFEIDVSSVKNAFDFDIEAENESTVDMYQKEISSMISSAVFDEIKEKIALECEDFSDKDSITIDDSDGKITAYVYCRTRPTEFQIESIRSRIESDIGIKVEFLNEQE